MLTLGVFVFGVIIGFLVCAFFVGANQNKWKL